MTGKVVTNQYTTFIYTGVRITIPPIQLYAYGPNQTDTPVCVESYKRDEWQQN